MKYDDLIKVTTSPMSNIEFLILLGAMNPNQSIEIYAVIEELKQLKQENKKLKAEL